MSDSGAFAPADAQRALLRFVVGPDDGAHQRFVAWADAVDIDVLPPGAHGLLPSAYRRAESVGIEHPWMARLRGVYRREWAAGRLARATTDEVRNVLTEGGVDSLRPADQQLAAVLEDPSTVAVSTPRITVPWQRLDDAESVLRRAGWRSESAAARRTLRDRLTWRRSIMTRADGASFDLVGFFNDRVIGDHRDAAFWRRASAAGGPGRVAPEDLFVAALCDQLEVEGALRWVLPAVALANAHPGGLDLSPVLDMPSARVVLPVVADRLAFLARELDPPGAAEMADELALVARRRTPAPGPVGSVSAYLGRSWRAVIRVPSASREIAARHGGAAGAVAAARHRSGH